MTKPKSPKRDHFYNVMASRREKPRTLEQLHALLLACEARAGIAWKKERDIFVALYATLEKAPGFDYQALLLSPAENGILTGFGLRPDSRYGESRVSMTLVNYQGLEDPHLWRDLSGGPNQKRVETRPQDAMYALALLSRVHTGPAIDAHRAAHQRTQELRYRTGVVRTAIGRAVESRIWQVNENTPAWQLPKLHFLVLGGITYLWDGRELQARDAFPHLGDCGAVAVNRGTASYALSRRGDCEHASK